MSFWDIIWFIIVSFAFIAYLLVLFNIIGDLFRDQDTSGVMKAVWLVLLLFFPFLTALVYLIVRGKGMAERSTAAAAGMKAQQDEYIRTVAGGGGGAASSADEIAKARSLLDAGTITQAEFDAMKAKALA